MGAQGYGGASERLVQLRTRSHVICCRREETSTVSHCSLDRQVLCEAHARKGEGGWWLVVGEEDPSHRGVVHWRAGGHSARQALISRSTHRTAAVNASCAQTRDRIN